MVTLARCRRDGIDGWVQRGGGCVLPGEACWLRDGRPGWVTADGRCERREAAE